MKERLIGSKTSHDGTRLISADPPIYIDRDSAGRALLTLSTIYEPNSGLTERSTVLCDPQRASVIWRSGSDTNLSPGLSVHGQIVDAPSIKSLPWSTQAYGTPRWGSSGQGWTVVDLGNRNIGGLQAHGYRWWFGAGGPSGNGDYKELWTAKDLGMDLLYIEETPSRGRGTRAEITHLRAREPGRSLFEMAQGHP
jgi:hypothetical protein